MSSTNASRRVDLNLLITCLGIQSQLYLATKKQQNENGRTTTLADNATAGWAGGDGKLFYSLVGWCILRFQERGEDTVTLVKDLEMGCHKQLLGGAFFDAVKKELRMFIAKP